MPNFGLETIAEYQAAKGDLVLRFSERVSFQPYTRHDGSKGRIKVLVVGAEQLENNGFGHYLPVEVHSYADKWTELQSTVPADAVREALYVNLIRYVLKETGY